MKLQALLLASPGEDSSTSREQFQAQRILVADDDACVRQLIASVLAGDGFEVSGAADGEQAWEALHREHFDLLVTDNEMPRLKGTKLIERIRNEGLSLPVIMASGSFSEEKLRATAQLQIVAVLPKPFDIVEFLETVKHTLQSAGATARVGRETLHQFHPSPQPISQYHQLNSKLCIPGLSQSKITAKPDTACARSVQPQNQPHES